MTTFNNPEEEVFSNIVRKGENAGNQHFLRFPHSFLPYQSKIAPFDPLCICFARHL